MQKYGFLESEINKWTKACGVQSGKAEQEGNDADNPNCDMPTIVKIGEKDLILKASAEFRERDERENRGDTKCDKQLELAMPVWCDKVEGKHPGDESPGQTEVLDAEDYPKKDYNEESDDDTSVFAFFIP